MNIEKESSHWKVCDSQRLMNGIERLGLKHGCTHVEATTNAMLMCEEFRAIPGQNLRYLALTATMLNRLDRLTPTNEHDAELKHDASAPYDPSNGVNQELIQRANQIMSRRKRYVLGR